MGAFGFLVLCLAVAAKRESTPCVPPVPAPREAPASRAPGRWKHAVGALRGRPPPTRAGKLFQTRQLSGAAYFGPVVFGDYSLPSSGRHFTAGDHLEALPGQAGPTGPPVRDGASLDTGVPAVQSWEGQEQHGSPGKDGAMAREEARGLRAVFLPAKGNRPSVVFAF